MADDDAQLESLIRRHLAGQLDPQLGRSRARFVREVLTGATPRMRLVGSPAPAIHRRLRFFGISAGAALAAGITIAVVLAPLLSPQDPAETRPLNGSPLAMHATPHRGSDSDVAALDAAPQDVEHALRWTTVDQGTIYLAGELPLRSVVRQADETVRWYDPEHRARVEVTVPRDQVMFVGYPSH